MTARSAPARATPRRSNAVLAAFSGPCLPLAAFGVALPVTLPEFYATFVGLELGVVAAVFMAVRLIDIVFDPFIGWGMDRTRTRFGRYRPWMALSTPMLMLAAYMMFVMVQPGAPPIYLFGWLLFLYLGFSIGTLGQLGWAAVLAPQYDQRSRVYGWWQVFNIIGVVLILVLPTVVVQTGIGAYADGVRIMGWAIVIALPVTIGLAMIAVPEPVTTGGQPHGSLGGLSQPVQEAGGQKAAAVGSVAGRGAGHHRVAAVLLLRPDQGLRSHPGRAVHAVLFRGGPVRRALLGLVCDPRRQGSRPGGGQRGVRRPLCRRDPGSRRQLRPDGRGHVHRRPALCGGPVPDARHDGRRRRRRAVRDRRGPHRPDAVHPVGHYQDRPRRRPDPLSDPAGRRLPAPCPAPPATATWPC